MVSLASTMPGAVVREAVVSATLQTAASTRLPLRSASARSLGAHARDRQRQGIAVVSRGTGSWRQPYQGIRNCRESVPGSSRRLGTWASLWPSIANISNDALPVASTSATTLESLGSVPSSTSVAIASTPSSATDVAAAAEGWTSSVLVPLVPYVEALPSFFHLPEGLPHAYAISIVLATILLRTGITLPITLWQRRRTKRMADLVAPEWLALKKTLPELVAKRCRRQKMSYSEYERELQRELKTQLKALTRRHNCSAMPTLLLPLAVHIPLFITMSMTLRTALLDPASALAAETVPWWSPPADLKAQFEMGAKILAARGIEGEALAKLTHIQGPSLAETDKSMVAPIALGLLNMVNVELGQWLRRGMTTEDTANARREEQRQAAEERRVALEKERKGQGMGKRVLASEIRAKAAGKAVPSPASASPPSGATDKVDLAPIRAAVLGNTLRAAAIGFVVVSSQAPTALILYWLSSASYTLVQNSAFAFADWRRMRHAIPSAAPSIP